MFTAGRQFPYQLLSHGWRKKASYFLLLSQVMDSNFLGSLESGIMVLFPTQQKRTLISVKSILLIPSQEEIAFENVPPHTHWITDAFTPHCWYFPSIFVYLPLSFNDSSPYSKPAKRSFNSLRIQFQSITVCPFNSEQPMYLVIANTCAYIFGIDKWEGWHFWGRRILSVQRYYTCGFLHRLQ